MTDKVQYKLMNQQIPFGMGNVRAVITDRKLTTPVKDIFIAELVTAFNQNGVFLEFTELEEAGISGKIFNLKFKDVEKMCRLIHNKKT